MNVDHGRFYDPVGEPVLRGFSLYMWALQQGKGNGALVLAGGITVYAGAQNPVPSPHGQAVTISLPRWSPLNRLASASGSRSKPSMRDSSKTISPARTQGVTVASISSMRCR